MRRGHSAAAAGRIPRATDQARMFAQASRRIRCWQRGRETARLSRGAGVSPDDGNCPFFWSARAASNIDLGGLATHRAEVDTAVDRLRVWLHPVGGSAQAVRTTERPVV